MTTPPDTGRLGFRDLYRALGESEGRITALIVSSLGPISTQLADHEKRLRDMERADDRRVGRSAGVISTLGAGKAFLLMLTAMVTPAVAVYLALRPQ